MPGNAVELILARRVRGITPSLTLAITAKAKKMKAEGLPVISFGAGEPDFDTPQFIKDAAVQALAKGQTKYTPESGTDELRQAIADKLKKDNNLAYEKEQIIVSCGAKHSIYNVIQALIDSGDEVLIPAPYWLSYPEMVVLAGGKPVIIPTREEDGFRITPEDLAKHYTPKTKLLIMNSPSNPTGAIYSRADLLALARFVKEKGLFVISDEIYEKLVYDGFKQISFAALDEEIKDLTITVNGHSKAYAMTGWRIGYAACRKDLAKAISSMQGHSTSHPTSFSQAGALAALTGPQDEIEKMRQVFEKRRDLMIAEIQKSSKIKAFKPGGAFYLFCNISRTGLSSLEFCEKILEKKHVACVPGAAFGADAYIRLSFATSEANIIEGVKRIREFADSL